MSEEHKLKEAQTCEDINKCSEKRIVINYSPIWHDGEVVCSKCGQFIRFFDAG